MFGANSTPTEQNLGVGPSVTFFLWGSCCLIPSCNFPAIIYLKSAFFFFFFFIPCSLCNSVVGGGFSFCLSGNGRRIFLSLFHVNSPCFLLVDGFILKKKKNFFPVLFFVVNLVPVSAYLYLSLPLTFSSLFLSLSSLSTLAIVFRLCSFMNLLLLLVSTLWTWFAAAVFFLQLFTHVRHRCKILPISFTLLVNVSRKERRTCPSQSESAAFQECQIHMSKICVSHRSFLIHAWSLTNHLMLLLNPPALHCSQGLL